ncbi:flagellar filament capping protein FliD [Stutzerimonas tarimensis]|uniref:Flagellar hook-associated protein 2 n=1 Tax=Stutzerimonas tarimensis TaxID=1507735 RepID=A0ABV7TBL6_9GAMM
MSGTTITGLGSGLDIDGLVKAMVTAEKAPKAAQINRQTAIASTTLSAVGTLKSAVDTFQTTLSGLTRNASNFAPLTAKSTKEDVATVTVGNGAAPGKYALEVEQLATGSKIASQVISGGSSASFGGGSLSISLGSATYSVNVNDGATLSEIRDSINTRLSSSAGISANIVTDSSGSRLVLSSETTGEGTDLTISGSNPSLSQLNVEAGVQQSGTGAGYLVQAQDARFSIDGLSMTSATNTVSNAISGLTIKLEGTESTTLNVGANTEGMKTSVESFVTAYNTLVTMTNALTKVTPGANGEVADAGALLGDASVRTMMNSLRNAMATPSDASGELKVLSQLGVSTQKDGTLAIDSAKLEKALATNHAAVGEFFSGDEGLLTRMGKSVSAYSETGGILSKRQDNLQANLTKLSEEQAALDRRVEKLETSLYSKFNSMDILLGQMESTRNSIYSMFDALIAQQRSR